MLSVPLDNRARILLGGPDAERFLQNIITTDLDALREGEARPGALLTPQGKILFDFLVSRRGPEGLRLECRTDVVSDFIKRLMLYRLRAKVDITSDDQTPILVCWGQVLASSPIESTASSAGSISSSSESTGSQTKSSAVRDMRFPDEIRVERRYGGGAASTGDPTDWTALRIRYGIAESGADYDLGDAFPHDVLLDQLGGVGFRKGCYIGQEVVSRMQHRGTARRRVLIAAGDAPLPAPGTDLQSGGKSIGTLRSVQGEHGLAIARIDKVKAATDAGEPITADGVRLTLSIPPGATFTFPQDQAEEA